MNRYLRIFISSLAVGTLATSAYAQTANSFTPYMGAEFGRVNFKNQTGVATILVNAIGGSASSTQDTGVGVGRLFGGLNFNENFGAELGYITTSNATATFNGVSSGGVAYTGTASQKTDGVDFSALIRPSISTGMNGLFARIGGHSLSIKNTVTIATGAASGASSSTVSGTGALFGIGYDGKISDKIDFRAAVTLYNQVANISSNDTTLFSVGIVGKF
jgi:hypothetical protein